MRGPAVVITTADVDHHIGSISDQRLILHIVSHHNFGVGDLLA